MNIDLSAPIWAIEHVAEAFYLSVDTAREHTYHHDFPAAKVGFARNLWRARGGPRLVRRPAHPGNRRAERAPRLARHCRDQGRQAHRSRGVDSDDPVLLIPARRSAGWPLIESTETRDKFDKKTGTYHRGRHRARHGGPSPALPPPPLRPLHHRYFRSGAENTADALEALEH
jgi:hypothetical protein